MQAFEILSIASAFVIKKKAHRNEDKKIKYAIYSSLVFQRKCQLRNFVKMIVKCNVCMRAEIVLSSNFILNRWKLFALIVKASLI